MTDFIDVNVQEKVQNTQSDFSENITPDVSDKGTLNKETEEKMFTQSQLEEHIRERIQRERKVNDSLLSVKKLLKNACEKGLINGKSYDEMAKDLARRLSEKQENGGEEAIPEGEETHTVADVGGKNNVSTTDGITEGANKEKDTSFFGVLSEIKAKYPKGEVERLLSGEGFERFAKGRVGSPGEIFDDYYSFMSVIFEDSGNDKEQSNHSELCSTAFSSQSGMTGVGDNLTKQQMEIAKSAGMSYREYAMLLESVPKRQQRTI